MVKFDEITDYYADKLQCTSLDFQENLQIAVKANCSDLKSCILAFFMVGSSAQDCLIRPRMITFWGRSIQFNQKSNNQVMYFAHDSRRGPPASIIISVVQFYTDSECDRIANLQEIINNTMQ